MAENMSKRERQKQRREAKLAQQRVAEQKARRNRLAVFALLGLVFAGLVGTAFARQAAERRAEEERRASVAAQLEDLGCTPDEEMEDRGQGHLDSAKLSEQPPEVLYPDRPATSGEHFGNWFKTGVYDELLDERVLIHNLEHGYVVAYYNEDAPEDQVTALKEYAQAQIDGSRPKLIVAPWDGELPEGANFAYTAWNQRQMCERYDEDTLAVFIDSHYSGEGVAPEKGLPPHLEEGQGTIDPGDEPFLLPPLGQEAAPDDGMSELPEDVIEDAEGEEGTS